MAKRLYRSTSDRQLAGVCGGIAKYLNLDPTVIRILWVIITLFGFAGLIAYIACVFIIPEEPPRIVDAE